MERMKVTITSPKLCTATRTALGTALAMFLAFSGRSAGAEASISALHSLGTSHPVHEGLEHLRKSLAGVMDVEIKTPRNERETVQGLLDGTVDAAVVSPASLQAIVRDLAMLDLIGMWRDRGHWSRALDGAAGRELAAIVERGSKKGDNGLQVLAYWGGTRRHLLTRRKGVEKIEDLTGLRLRIALNPVRSKMWKTLGVQPVLPTHTDITVALRDGSVEGAEEEAEVILQTRLYEAASHLTETGHAITTRLLLISKPAWGRLTPAQQAALSTASQRATNAARTSEESRETVTLTALKERHGVTLHSFRAYEDLRSRTLDFRARYADELNAARLFKSFENAAKP